MADDQQVERAGARRAHECLGRVPDLDQGLEQDSFLSREPPCLIVQLAVAFLQQRALLVDLPDGRGPVGDLDHRERPQLRRELLR